MNSVWLLLISVSFYILAYRFYCRLLASKFGEDPNRKTPAETHFDGVDYVPAKNTLVLFGHHFSSICGAGPIVGPALACAYWGWGPSFFWVLAGSIFLGAVSDYASLFVSIRSDGKTIAEIARTEISPKARVLLSLFIWISIVLVIAVFSIFAAKTFIAEPDAVVPSLGLIPLALWTGWFLYGRLMSSAKVTLLSLSVLVLLLAAGVKFPILLQPIGGLSPLTLWILLLLAYCFAASVAPVHILLQPRDYLASFILFAAIGVGVVGVFVTHPPMQGEMYHGFSSLDWPEAGMLWPMLFVTVACGAISGFHSLVSSGTTSKQIANETQARCVGYGGMLTEGLVGILVVICVAAGLSKLQLSQDLRAGGPIEAFAHGYGILSAPLLGSYGTSFAVLALNAFILTTLDTATRIARYLTTELFGIKNKYLATLVVVLAGGSLALTGQWAHLWPTFGASNQLIAGLALLVASCWMLHRGRVIWYTLIPSVVMLVTTIGAFAFQFFSALNRTIDGYRSPDFLIAGISLALIAISVVIILESLHAVRTRLFLESGSERV